MNLLKKLAIATTLPTFLMSCSSVNKDLRETKSLLKDIKTIEIKSVNNQVLIDGYTLSSTQLKRINQVVELYGSDKVTSFVHLNAKGLKHLAKKIEKEIDNPSIYTTAFNGIIMLEGSESYQGEKRRAQEIANSLSRGLFPEVNQSRSVSSSQKNIINNILPIMPTPHPARRFYKSKKRQR